MGQLCKTSRKVPADLPLKKIGVESGSENGIVSYQLSLCGMDFNFSNIISAIEHIIGVVKRQ